MANKTFYIKVPEVHYQLHKVEAENEADAFLKVENGDSTEVGHPQYHTTITIGEFEEAKYQIAQDVDGDFHTFEDLNDLKDE